MSWFFEVWKDAYEEIWLIYLYSKVALEQFFVWLKKHDAIRPETLSFIEAWLESF